MTNNTIPNVPRELLDRCCKRMYDMMQGDLHEELRALLSAPSPANHVEDVRAMVADPSPAGVDGLEVVGYFFQHEETGNVMSVDAQQVDWGFEANNPRLHRVCALADYDKAQAIIDGLRGEVAEERAKVAQLEEGIPRIMEASYQFRQQRDQQARRIGELEGLLDRVKVSLSLDDTEWGYSAPEKYKLLADIRAAMSAGKDVE